MAPGRADPDVICAQRSSGLTISVPGALQGCPRLVNREWVRGLCPLWAFPPQDQSSHQVEIIHRQEIPAVIKIPPTFIPALVVYKVISIPKEGFEDFFTAPCF